MPDSLDSPDAKLPTERVPARALTVVVPVHDEERWIETCLDALAASAEAGGVDLDVVVVDDGSTDGTPDILARLARTGAIRVHTQANAGRMAARRAGVALARESTVLLLDSRVIADRDALGHLMDQRQEHPERAVWSGHVDVASDGRPFAPFWSGLVKIGWRAYTAHPRVVSFGAEDFDRYPKGTGCLVAPREVLAEAMEAFTSLYGADSALSSDDTRMLRHVAEGHRFWIDPAFRFTYHGKSDLRGFVRQSYFRGTTFVDGYLGRSGPVGQALVAAVAVGGVGVVAAVRRPVLAPVGLAVVAAAAAVGVRQAGGRPAEVRAAAVLTPVFAPVFGVGVLRGLALAAATRLRGRRQVDAPSEQ